MYEFIVFFDKLVHVGYNLSSFILILLLHHNCNRKKTNRIFMSFHIYKLFQPLILSNLMNSINYFICYKLYVNLQVIHYLFY